MPKRGSAKETTKRIAIDAIPSRLRNANPLRKSYPNRLIEAWRIKMRIKDGDRFKVKRDYLTRDFGIRVCGQHSGDSKAWPGEIGTIATHHWIAFDGTEMSGIWIEFDRGRSACVDSYDADDWGHLVKVKP